MSVTQEDLQAAIEAATSSALKGSLAERRGAPVIDSAKLGEYIVRAVLGLLAAGMVWMISTQIDSQREIAVIVAARESERVVNTEFRNEWRSFEKSFSDFQREMQIFTSAPRFDAKDATATIQTALVPYDQRITMSEATLAQRSRWIDKADERINDNRRDVELMRDNINDIKEMLKDIAARRREDKEK